MIDFKKIYKILKICLLFLQRICYNVYNIKIVGINTEKEEDVLWSCF